MKLKQLFQAVREASFIGDVEVELSGLEFDSRRVTPGQIFFAINGYRQDGHRFIQDALGRGALAVVSESTPAQGPGTHTAAWVQVPNARRALALAASEFYGHPSEQMQLVGVTGTNGKTTVSFLIASILDAARKKPALFGTIEYRLIFGEADYRTPAPNTTPESLDLQRMLRQVVDGGGQSAVMEVSSHALALDRVAGCSFHTAAWTNFSRDHLDFHAGVEDYFAAKAKLFLATGENVAPQLAVLNADDPRCSSIAEQTPARILRFGIEQPADVSARKWKTTRSGTSLTAQTPSGPIELESPLVGRHNVYNLLAAAAAAIALEATPEQIQQGVQNLRVPGRMETVEEAQPFRVYVDYAHTEDALKNLVASARELDRNGDLIIVFGCGGDRDRSKRPLMGLAAAACDRVILTSDNPRSEDPLQVINDVTVGLQKASANYVIEPDRKAAIERALAEARAGDTVLIAGKGHERYQIVEDTQIPFDDRETAHAALRQMGYGQESGVGSQDSEEGLASRRQ
ncbi:MAG: UDP-N-acetylmuramoyl-L-alanyl-D-glutamate--2,6-diaminopimelate ligase [Acidobacteria bacterium]|nr:UDP-N-acetylmuramoyl-L-alanyl-D-glutamate--2,6-diaminopimelate ligase [Acidobacteriota bacterium]